MGNRYLITITLLILCATASAQQPACTSVIPVTVILPNGTIVRGLNQDNVVARNKHESLPIQAFANDRGGRRILFVAENGKDLPEAARRIETGVLSYMLTNARSEDSFALLTARGPRVELRFGANREALQAAVNKLAALQDGKNSPNGVLDTVWEAASWFQHPHPGDAIVLLTMGIESPHSVSFRKVRDALTGSGIRLFGFQLGQVIGAYYWATIEGGPYGFNPNVSVFPNEENLFGLSAVSGGFVLVENTSGEIRQYKLTDERLLMLAKMGGQMYKAIAEYYRVDLRVPSKDYILDLAEPIRKQFPKAGAIYPRVLPDCAHRSESGTRQ